MIGIGNFFFKYRNYLFVLLYIGLFLPSRRIFTENQFGSNYYFIPIVLGLVITFSGQLLRGLTIGLAYMVRGGQNKKISAENLVTGGMFNHCRNPLYLGNILMFLGLGILSNSLLFVAILMPLLLFIYQAIVLAEEKFLRAKFGKQFNDYCQRVNRWLINFNGIMDTIKSMKFNWKRWMLKEYNMQFVWLSGITLLLLLKHPQIIYVTTDLRNVLIAVILSILLSAYLLIRHLKKSGRVVE